MRINRTHPEFLASEQLKVTRAAGAEEGTSVGAGPAPATRSDTIPITAARRTLAAQTVTHDGGRVGLTPERAEEIRQRIMRNAYDSLDMVDQVARRMLARGEL
jgi:hypothetical protein